VLHCVARKNFSRTGATLPRISDSCALQLPQNRAFSRRFVQHAKPQFFSHSSNNPFIHSSGFGFVAAVPRQDFLPRRVRLTLAPPAPIFARLFSLVDAILTC
jgi:hypothetical protein